jgi:hypothetical protein
MSLQVGFKALKTYWLLSAAAVKLIKCRTKVAPFNTLFFFIPPFFLPLVSSIALNNPKTVVSNKNSLSKNDFGKIQSERFGLYN